MDLLCVRWYLGPLSLLPQGSSVPHCFYASLPTLHSFLKAPCPLFCVDIDFMLPFLLQTEQKPKPLLGRGYGGRGCSLDWVSPNHPGGKGRVTLAWKGHRRKAETGTKTETESVGSTDKADPAWLGGTGWGGARAEICQGSFLGDQVVVGIWRRCPHSK